MRFYIMINGSWEGDQFERLSDALRAIAAMIDQSRENIELIDRMPGGSKYQCGLREHGPAIPRKIDVFGYTAEECYHSFAITEE